MQIMDQIANFMEVIKEVLGIPVVVSHTISEGVSDGINDGISRNRKWVERGAVKLILFFVGLFFFCWGIIEIGNNALPQYKGVTAIIIGLVMGLAIVLLADKS